MTTEPLVSFVVPCYQQGHLLAECVLSILAQTYRNFEILIMDNCSPDSTPAVARSFDDPRVKYFRNDSNLGHIRNFNKGIRLSRGQYLWILFADDLLRSPQALAQYVELMERHPRVGYVFCRAVELRDGQEAGVILWADCGEEDAIWDGKAFLIRLIEYDCIVSASGMARRECYEKLGLFSTDLLHACDWYQWCIFALYYDVGYFAEPMVYCRVHEQSLTAAFRREDAHVLIGDNLAVVWRTARQAEMTGLPALRIVCEAALLRGVVKIMNAAREQGPGPGLDDDDLEAVMLSRIPDPDEVKSILARAFTMLGDQQYWRGEYGQAGQSYRLGLRVRPWRLKSWAKYLLLKTGVVGIWLRQLRGQLRRRRIQLKYAR